MADYEKMFFRLLFSIFIFLQSNLASRELDGICGFPGAPAHGRVKPDETFYKEGDSVTYSCRVGYILLGTPINWCSENGTWSKEVPVCDESMTTLGIAHSTSVVPGHDAKMAIDRIPGTCTSLKPRERAYWSIDLGKVHKIVSVSVTVASKDYMKFSIFVAETQGNTLSYKVCASLNGRFETLTVRFTCSGRKGLEGEIVHIENELQKEFFEICEVEVQVEKDSGYECGRPDRKPFSMNYKPQNAKVEYYCDKGYELTKESERVCLPSGQWSGEAPACERIVCEHLDPPKNGKLTFIVENGGIPLEGSTANYECDHGYKLEGHINRMCQKDGSWTGTDPVCKVIHCPVPQGKRDGETYRLLDGTNLVDAKAELRCKKGVVKGDDPFIICTQEGEWSEPQSYCEPRRGSTMEMSEPKRIVNRGGIIFGMAVAAIMMVIILAAFYVVKRRRDANKPQLPSRQHEPIAPPPRPPPREKGLKSTLRDLVSRDSSAYKYESLNLENGDGVTAWKTRSLPHEPGNSEGITDDQGVPRRTLSYDDPEKLSSRGGAGIERKPGKVAPDEQQDTSKKGSRVTTPVKSGDEYAAVDYDKKRQSRLLKGDSEDRGEGASSAADGEQLRELPPIPKDEEEEEMRAQSAEAAASPSTDKEREEVASVESEDVSLPIGHSESQTSEAPTPSPDVVIENQVDGPSASPSTTPTEITPGRRRRRGVPDQPSTEDVPEARRTRTRRRAEPEEPESPSPAAPSEGERPSRRAQSGRLEEPESPPAAPAEGERPSRRARSGRLEEPESPPAAPAEEERPSRRARGGRPDETESPPAAPVEEERPTRRTRPGITSRYDTPTTTFQPSSRRRY